MAGIFIAKGPVFKVNYKSDSVMNNIDVKPLLCSILRIECININGSIKNMKEYLLNDEDEKDASKFSNYVSRNYLFFLYVAFMYFLSVFSVVLLSFGNLYKIKYQLYIPTSTKPKENDPNINELNTNTSNSNEKHSTLFETDSIPTK